MSKVVVLGGAGAVGSVAAKTLGKQAAVTEVVIGDLHPGRAAQVADVIEAGKGRAVTVNAEDPASIRAAIKDADVVLNCVGPFYKTVKTILGVVLDAKIQYVDVCDDVDVTLEILGWDKRAKDAGVTALIGMGNSPGATNLLAKLAYDTFLEETHSVDIFHAHGGEPVEGAGVIGHRFHCMSIPIPMFLDGELKHVNYFAADGIMLRQKFNFPVLGNDVMLYPYPHPEQVTLPRYMKLNQVTNKGTVLPAEYYDLTREVCHLGLASREAVRVGDREITPYDFAIAFILRERERILKATNFGGQRGCCSIIVKGKNRGLLREYRFHLASKSQALGEGTGIPAAVGVLLMLQGKITAQGVFPPEGCVNPQDFVAAIPSVIELDKKKEGGESFGGVIVQKVDENGQVTNISL